MEGGREEREIERERIIETQRMRERERMRERKVEGVFKAISDE